MSVQYIDEIAAQVIALVPDVLDRPEAEAQEIFRSRGVDLMFTEIKQSLHDFGVDFDVYFHENHLHESGAVEHAIDRLRQAWAHLRRGRRGLAPHDGVRGRQGPSHHQE